MQPRDSMLVNRTERAAARMSSDVFSTALPIINYSQLNQSLSQHVCHVPPGTKRLLNV